MYISTGTHRFTLNGVDEPFRCSLSVVNAGNGVNLIRIKLKADYAAVPPAISLEWTHPVVDIQASWHPAVDRNKSYKADWMRNLRSNAASSAPVMSLFNLSGRNRLTFAFSDALHTVESFAGVREESAEFKCGLILFTELTAPLEEYEATLRVDTRDVPYYECLDDIQQWWSAMPEYRPAAVPDSAKAPMYSTWYSMHQNLTAQAIEEQCAIASTFGMEAVIVDDGWQTEDNRRGYAYCGDWQVSREKVPDMAGLVAAVHRLGMKFILWYSVPFVGRYSQAWDRFKDKFLDINDRMGAGILDPRYPEVREYIISTYEQALEAWDLDGFKLDFVDRFYQSEAAEETAEHEGKDIASLPVAVDRLLTDVITRLRNRKPDIMIEFRQSYIGPAMRKYGNMFRAGDCPNDGIQNRVRTLDIRLISGRTAPHADMIMWNPQEPVESAALQLINVLFAVPQISVLLDRIPEEHQAMLRHWLGFWKRNRDILLDGRLKPNNPELLYPSVEASRGEQAIVVTYHDSLIRISGSRGIRRYTVINGTLRSELYLDLNDLPGEVTAEIMDCCGNVVEQGACRLASGIHRLQIPPAGLAILTLS